MKRILINAKQEEEIRVAIIDGRNLLDLNLEVPSLAQKKGNIYKGTVTRIEPSLNAVFVDYGASRNGFLPYKEISSAYLNADTSTDTQHSDNQRSNSQHSNSKVQPGQEVLVQVQRGERSNKGAALTTRISLAGRYLVLMPNNVRATGVSRRIQGRERNEMRDILDQVDANENEGIIVRTAGIGHRPEELRQDLEYLRKLWKNILNSSKACSAPSFIYEEGDIVIRTLRDHFNDDIEEIIIDNQQIYDRAVKLTKTLIPQYVDRIHLYEESTPLFSHHHLEDKIATIYERKIILSSGGSLVFDHTEALLSIDINSGKATKTQDIEETALAINMEACEEIALQLRMRDAGGLIVIDFIDMRSPQSQRKVENKLAQLIASDSARTQLGSISRFGLLEMSRQRLRPSLGDVNYITCPRCNGDGTIRTLKSSTIAVLRMMEDEAVKEMTARVVAHLPVDVSTYLLNEKRNSISNISEHYNVQLDIVPDIHMETPHFQISRYRADDRCISKKASYELTDRRDEHPKQAMNQPDRNKAPQEKEQASVEFILSDSQLPKISLFSRIWNALKRTKRVETETSARKHGRRNQRRHSSRGNDRNRQAQSQHKEQASSNEPRRASQRKTFQDNDDPSRKHSRGGDYRNNRNRDERHSRNKNERYSKDGSDERGRSNKQRSRQSPDKAQQVTEPSGPTLEQAQEKQNMPSASEPNTNAPDKSAPTALPQFGKPQNLVQVETQVSSSEQTQPQQDLSSPPVPDSVSRSPASQNKTTPMDTIKEPLPEHPFGQPQDLVQIETNNKDTGSANGDKTL